MTEFYEDKHGRRKDGLHPQCKTCRAEWGHAHYLVNVEARRESQRWREIKFAYGITKDQWLALFEAQSGLCGICRTPLSKARGTRARAIRTTVDHDHDTEVIRGLLCGPCNLGIGFLRHDANLLAAAMAYLSKPPPTL